MKTVSRLFLLSFIFSLPAFAQNFEFFPGAKYDPAIPTLKQVVGHAVGEKITLHHELEKYLSALEKAAPTHVKIFTHGATWEGKSLYHLAIGSPENIARLDEIKTGMRKLADPRTTSKSEADKLISSLPSIVWLAYSVHGNEISSTDAALMTAYHLLAVQGDSLVENALKNSVIVIDPMQNPDGRDRFINYFRQNVGLVPNEDLQSAEHNEIWPGGRTNHYLFDMNRDWFAQTQPETQGRAKAYLDWFPLVFVDLHEMGTHSSYYFAPQALPLNPNMPKFQLEWFSKFGRNNAKWFDKFRFDYFTREGYDAFYPGYGEGWPTFHGSIGMTYEQASVRGLVARRNDETLMLYRDSVQHHFISSLSTIENTANNREALLKYFYEFRRTAIEESKTETVKEYIIAPGNDPRRAERFAAMLMNNGIEVKRAEATFTNAKAHDYYEDKLESHQFPAGTFIVSLAQPAKRLLKTLMDKKTEQDKEFVDAQRKRLSNRQRDEFYDVTAWSLPLLWDVNAFTAEAESKGNFTLLKDKPNYQGSVKGNKANLAYLMAWNSQQSAKALADLFRQDIRVHSADKEFKLAGNIFQRGSLVIKVKDNPADLQERLQKVAATYGVDFYSTDDSWVESGINFGSANVQYLKKPRVALAYNTPTSTNSVGWVRYLIEQKYGYPVTTIRTEQLGGADLTKYNVLILPEGSRGGYSQMLNPTKLREWCSNGGTLITIGEAAAWAADEKVGLLATKLEKRKKPEVKPADTKAENKDGKAPAQPEESKGVDKAIEPDDEFPSLTPGAIVRLSVNQEHWLGFGYGENTNVIVESNRIFTPLKLDKGVNVARYLPEGKMLLSGLMWDDAQAQLPGKAFLMYSRIGGGHIIAFAEEPNYRAFLDGLNLMMMNAVFFGPGH